MWILLMFALTAGAGRLALGAHRALRGLPRRNDDMVFF